MVVISLVVVVVVVLVSSPTAQSLGCSRRWWCWCCWWNVGIDCGRHNDDIDIIDIDVDIDIGEDIIKSEEDRVGACITIINNHIPSTVREATLINMNEDDDRRDRRRTCGHTNTRVWWDTNIFLRCCLACLGGHDLFRLLSDGLGLL